MLKTYILNQNLNSCSFNLQGEGGNSVQYSFKGGNVITNTRPFLQLKDAYFQDLLEQSEMFKTGRVKFDQATKNAIREAELKKKELHEQKDTDEAENHVESSAPKVKVVGNIVSVTQAINYLEEEFGIVVRTASAVSAEAKKRGIEFPNLKIAKK